MNCKLNFWIHIMYISPTFLTSHIYINDISFIGAAEDRKNVRLI